MAVFKVTSYTKHRGGAKASIRYIQGRPGRGGERLERLLFGVDGAMTREQAYRLIDEAARGTRFFRLVISPDSLREDSRKDLHWWEITKKTMQLLEERLNQAVAWVAAEHNDHSPNRHVHIIAAVKGRLRVQDLKLLREAATQAALLQRQQLDLDQTRDYRRAWGVRSPSLKPQTAGIHTTGRQITGRLQTARPAQERQRSKTDAQSQNSPVNAPFGLMACSCPFCLASQPMHATHRVHRCQLCGKRLHQESKLKLGQNGLGERKEEPAWEL